MAETNRGLRIGLMGLGQIGRQIYRQAAASEDIEIVAVADIGRPEVLQYLLETGGDKTFRCRIEGNFLRGEGSCSRMPPVVIAVANMPSVSSLRALDA